MKYLYKTLIILTSGLISLHCKGQVNVPIEVPIALTNQITGNSEILDSVIYYLDRNNFVRARVLISIVIASEKDYKAFYISGASEMKGKYEQMIKTLDQQIATQDQKIKTQNETIEASKNRGQKDMIDFMEEFLNKRDLSDNLIKELEKRLDLLNRDIIEKDKQILTLTHANIKQKDSMSVELSNWQEKYHTKKNEHDSLDKKLKKYKTAVQFGLSIGFNYYFNNQKDYFIRSDSTVREAGRSYGASGMISSVISIRISERNIIVINIPLGDFTSDPSRAVGIFNQRIGLGLGYARRLSSELAPHLLLAGIFNISPYQRIDYNEIKNKKFNTSEYTKLKAEDYGSTTDYSYSFTLGLVYNFINTK